jgi:acyl dehydratase
MSKAVAVEAPWQRIQAGEHMPVVIDLAGLKHRVGQDIAVSDWITVRQEAIAAFAEVTGDRQWIHLDVERSRRESPFGGTIAHGFLTLSLLPQLQEKAFQLQNLAQIINYGLNRVRFPAPVPAGSAVRGRFHLLAWDEIGAAVQLTWHCIVEVQGQAKPALVAEWLLRHFPAATASPAEANHGLH